MPGRTFGRRTAGRTATYSVSLLQAAAALYGRDAVEGLADPSSEAATASRSQKKSRE